MNGGADHQSSQRLPMSNTETQTVPPPPGGVPTTSVSMAAIDAPPHDVSLNTGSGGAALVREQDHFLPMTNVTRIMRKVLPAYAKISDDAKETVQECVSEYISFITSEANERCQLEQRRTITADDILWAMRKLGFDDYVEPLSLYLSRYREIEGDHSGSRRGNQLPPLTRFHSQISTAATNYGDVPSSPSPLPTLAPNQMLQLPHGEYADDATGCCMNAYEDGSCAGSSSSWRGNSST